MSIIFVRRGKAAIFKGTPDAQAARQAMLDAQAARAGALSSETNAAASAAVAATAATNGTVPALDLPFAPTSGYRLLSAATGEQITWNGDYWQSENGRPFATVLARFDNLGLNQPLDSLYHADSWRAARDFYAAMGFQRIGAVNYFVGDGAGRAIPVTANTYQPYYFQGAAVIAAGANDWEGYVDVVPGAGATGDPVFFRTDAVNSAGLCVTNGGRLQIVDLPYNTAGGTPIVRQSVTLAGFDKNVKRRLFLRCNGNELTAYDQISGTTIKAGTSLMSGHLAGFWSRSVQTAFSRMVVWPRDRKGYVQIGTMRFLGGRGIHHDPNGGLCAGIDRGDHVLLFHGSEANRTGDANALNNGPANIQLSRLEKDSGLVTWLATVDSNTSSAVTDRMANVEGACPIEIGGVVHLAVPDRTGTPADPLRLYRCPNPADLAAAGKWPRATINAQNVFNPETIIRLNLGDGKRRLLCFYQGLSAADAASKGVAAGGMNGGGILMLTYNGSGNPLVPGNWTEVALAQCPGAWGLAGRGEEAKVVDLDGDGSRWLVFGSRKNARNTDGLGGVYAIRLDDTGGIDSGTLKPLRTIYNAGAEDVTMLDFVDLGSGHGLDLAYLETASGNVNFLTNPRALAGAWTKSSFAMPASPDINNWNLWSSGHKRNGRSVLLAVVGSQQNGGLYALSWTGAAWESKILHRLPVTHTFEKPQLVRVKLNSGLYMWLGGDDTAHHQRGFVFLEESARAPVEPVAAAAADEPETTALVAAMTTPPSAARKTAINRLIKRLKSFVDAGTGISAWAYHDKLWVFAAQDAQAAGLDWKNPAAAAPAINGAPVFTANKGYTFDGGTAHLATGYNPTVASLGFALNDAHVGAYVLTGSAAGAGPDLGSANDVTRVRAVTGAISVKLNRTAAAGATNTAGLTLDVPMHALAVRTGAATTKVYANGQLAGTLADASSTNSTEILIGKGGASGSNRQVAIAHVGRAFPTDAMSQEVSLAYQCFLGEIGALG